MLPDLTQYMWIAWLVLALVFIIIELLTLEFTFLMLAAGALIGGLGVNLLGGPWWLQIGVAAALSAVLLFTIRPLLLRMLHRDEPDSRTNVDALYGMGGRVVQSFVDGDGSVRLDNGETWTARLAFDPERDGDFAGLLALIDENHFLALGVEQVGGERRVVVRQRSAEAQAETGELIASAQLAHRGEVELSVAIDRGTADLAWRPAGSGAWQPLAEDVDVEPMSSIHSGLFTGVVVGPYAVRGPG